MSGAMGRSGRERGREYRRWSSRRAPLLLAALLVAGAALAAGPVSGLAQDDETPASRAECAIPDAAPAATADLPRIDAPARGTPAGATPVAGSAPPTATPDAVAALEAELTAVARALAACLSGGQARLVAALATENYLGQLYGGGIPLPREDYLALAAELDPVPTTVRSLGDVRREGDDEATAEVVSVVGRQLLRSRWTFVRASADDAEVGRVTWRVDAEAPLPLDPPADANRLRLAIEENAFGLSEDEVEGPDVLLVGRNGGAEDHEMLVLRLDGRAEVADILRQPGPALPDDISYVGQATVPAGDEAELVLVDLEPGRYAVVCLFPTPRGTPHLALGEQATFEVE